MVRKSLSDVVFILLIGTFFLSIQQVQAQAQSTPEPFDHSIFDRLLKKYVSTEGEVDYANFKSEQKVLQQYLASLSRKPPQDSWTRNQKMAYWINLYNAFTTELVLQYYPIKSIREIGDEIPIFYGDNPWDIEFINIGDTLYSLDKIEHEVLKKRFNDPRIHFALVCAASSCPNLRRDVYTGSQLDAQLTNQAIEFMNDSRKNVISENEIRVSEIFQWYQEEFFKDESLLNYLNRFSGYTIEDEATIEYIPFDWSLNDSN